MNASDPAELESNLAAVLHDPVPSALMEGGAMVFAWSTISGELASLESSGTDDPALAGVRAGGVAVTLSFAAGELIIELEFDRSTRRATGQVLPATAGRMTVVGAHDDPDGVTVDVNVHGVFSVDSIPEGPTQLRFEADGALVHTDWFVA